MALDEVIEGKLKAALEAPDLQAASAAAVGALTAVGFPLRQETPGKVAVVGSLKAAQRELATRLCQRKGLYVRQFALPGSVRVRRRWLGVDPPTVLERVVDFDLGEGKKRWPLWRVLAALSNYEDERILGPLPPLERAELLAAVALQEYELRSRTPSTTWSLRCSPR